MADDFRKLNVWKEGYKLVLEVYRLSSQFPKEEVYALTSQIRRSSNAVIANLAEACGRYFKKDKVRMLYMARGEIEETKSHLKVARGLMYAEAERVDGLVQQYCVLAKRMNALIRHYQTN